MSTAQLQRQMAELRRQMLEAEAAELREFGARLKAARNMAGLTQQEAGDALGLSRTQITNLEAGKSETSFSNLRAFCHLYRCSADYLLGLAALAQEAP